MESKECRRFEGCSAPLCPMDAESLKNGIWYPDEDICPLNDSSRLLWVRNQKKIAKRCRDGYFNIRMLDHSCIIKRGITGIDPDLDDDAQTKKWLKGHPVKRELTDDEKEVLRQRIQAVSKVGSSV